MVMVYCEGPTEWYVVRKLNKFGILKNNSIIKIDDANEHIKNNPRSITSQFLEKLPRLWTKFLLIYDQEDHPTPQDFVNSKFAHLDPWNRVTNNIFRKNLNGRIIYLHINTALSPNGFRDFDGYLWDLINRLGPQLAQFLFNLLPQYIRNSSSSPNIHNNIHRIGTTEIPKLMQDKGFSIQRSKGLLYAYITALQMSKSHVWFAEKLIEVTVQNGYTNKIEQSFATLIDAWKQLLRE